MEFETTINVGHHVSFAHRLKDDTGKCRHLHGHTWIITAKILGEVQKVTGMIVDFWRLKTAIKERLDAEYDHSTVLQKWDPYIPMIESDKWRLIILEEPPTAEILAARMSQNIQEVLDAKFDGLRIMELELEETPSNKVQVKIK